jgi:hypothetical protein
MKNLGRGKELIFTMIIIIFLVIFFTIVFYIAPYIYYIHQKMVELGQYIWEIVR